MSDQEQGERRDAGAGNDREPTPDESEDVSEAREDAERLEDSPKDTPPSTGPGR